MIYYRQNERLKKHWKAPNMATLVWKLDCFCGSGVTPAVAEQLGRRWIACDQNPEAIKLTRERLLAREQIRPFVIQTITC